MNTAPLVIIVSGPAGAGKTSVCDQLVRSSDAFTRLVTCTSRPPRLNEVDGRDYHFVDKPEFERRIKAGEFLEYAQVYGCWYGSPLSGVTAAFQDGKDLVLNIDVQGAASIRTRAPEVTLAPPGGRDRRMTLKDALVTVFIMPPSVQLLEDRLKKRATDDAETIRKRLAIVRDEMKRWTEYDYVIVTGKLQEDFERLRTIVAAEKLRATRLDFEV